jgi:hypothetical protein
MESRASEAQPRRVLSAQMDEMRIPCQAPTRDSDLSVRGRSRFSRSPIICSSSTSRPALVSPPPFIPSNSCARVVPPWLLCGSGRRAVRSRVRSAFPFCASCSSDANDYSPGGDLARDADALHLPHLASPYATQLSRRAATIIDTLAHVLHGAAWVYPVTNAD